MRHMVAAAQLRACSPSTRGSGLNTAQSHSICRRDRCDRVILEGIFSDIDFCAHAPGRTSDHDQPDIYSTLCHL